MKTEAWRRLLALCSAGLALSACAHLQPVQAPGTARIVIGNQATIEPAPAIAPRYPIYAILAAKAYEDVDPRRPDRPLTGPTAFAFEEFDEAGNRRRLDYTEKAHALLARHGRWQRVAAHVGPLGCDRDERPNAGCAGHTEQPGLVVHLWRPLADPCSELVIAFRGTDSKDDFLANLRWFTRHLEGYDQYEQVQGHIRRLIREAWPRGCPSGRGPKLVAVGHSLGGGLAQQAAYVDTAIQKVYAFDPSPVTGYYDVHVTATSRDLKDLRIERVYEHGEILAYLRFVLRHLYPPAVCDPTIHLVRFNQLNGRPVEQHGIAPLAAHMVHLTEKTGRPPNRATHPSPFLADAPMSERGGCHAPAANAFPLHNGSGRGRQEDGGRRPATS